MNLRRNDEKKISVLMLLVLFCVNATEAAKSATKKILKKLPAQKK